MKEKVLFTLKHFVVSMFVIVCAVLSVSGIGKKGTVFADCSVSASYDSSEKKITASGSYTNSKTGSFEFVLQIKNGDSWGKVNSDSPYLSYGKKNYDVSFDVAISGTYRVIVSEKDYNHYEMSTAYSEEIVVDLGGSGGSGETGLPCGIDNPKVLNLPHTSTTVVDKWIQTRTGAALDKMYYKLIVEDKAYYNFRESAATLALYKGLKEENDNLLAGATDLNSEQLLDKGEYLLVGYGTFEGKETNVTIACKDFLDIKSITCQDRYEVLLGSKSLIKLVYDPATGYESQIKWTASNSDAMEITGYDYNAKMSSEDKSIAYIYARQLGEYTSTVTTSEGITKTITVMVKPNPAKAKEMTAFSDSKKKARLTIEWEGDTDAYTVYMKSGSDFKKVADVNGKTYKFSNLTPGKTYYFKIESKVIKNGNVLCSSMSGEMVGVTAPYSAPTIKSAKQKGKTSYTKPYTRNESYWSNGIYHHLIRHYGNVSSATVKLSIKKVKGASYYFLSTGNGDKGVGKTTGTVYLGYKGKIKAKTQKIKIRGVWVKGVCTAYGPYSKAKTVKIKAAK